MSERETDRDLLGSAGELQAAVVDVADALTGEVQAAPGASLELGEMRDRTSVGRACTT